MKRVTNLVILSRRSWRKHGGTCSCYPPTKSFMRPPAVSSTSRSPCRSSCREMENRALFSTGTSANITTEVSSSDGELFYRQALEMFEAAEKERLRKEEKKSAEQFEAWNRAQERSQNKINSKNEGVAVVRTIAKQTRRERQANESKEDDLKTKAQALLEKAAIEYSHPEALVRLGNSALKEARSSDDAGETVKKAVGFYEKVGIAGSAAGWFNLGHLYWSGYPSMEDTSRGLHDHHTEIILSVDKEAAMRAFNKAIELGDADAMYFVGVLKLSEDDAESDCPPGDANENLEQLQLGLELVERAASLGHGGALYYLALLHYNGNSKLDIAACPPPEFVERLDSAAEAGNADALFLKGHSLFNGQDGYPQNYPAALEMFLAAAESGNSDAAISAGAMLHQGTGVPQDQHRAFELYQLGGELGNLEGWRNVVACYLLGQGVPRCEKTAHYIAKTMLKEDP